MSSSENGSVTPSERPPAKRHLAARGFWALVGNATVLAAVVGALGTVFVSILQHVSAYHDSVAKLAKEDLDNATSALTEAVTALSNPLSLQEQLIWFYSAAKKTNTDTDDDAYETKNARLISKNYEGFGHCPGCRDQAACAKDGTLSRFTRRPEPCRRQQQLGQCRANRYFQSPRLRFRLR